MTTLVTSEGLNASDQEFCDTYLVRLRAALEVERTAWDARPFVQAIRQAIAESVPALVQSHLDGIEHLFDYLDLGSNAVKHHS